MFAKATKAINASKRTHAYSHGSSIPNPTLDSNPNHHRLLQTLLPSKRRHRFPRMQTSPARRLQYATRKPQNGNRPKLRRHTQTLEDAKETCMSTKIQPVPYHQKIQNTLQHTKQLYETMLDDYKNRYTTLTTKPSPRAPM